MERNEIEYEKFWRKLNGKQSDTEKTLNKRSKKKHINHGLIEWRNTQENPLIINNLTDNNLIHSQMVFNKNKSDFQKYQPSLWVLSYYMRLPFRATAKSL